MTIALSDIRQAVLDYFEKVETTVSEITPDHPSTLNPGEDGTFTVTVKNRSESDGGMKLVNIVFHLALNTDVADAAHFIVPSGRTVRASVNPNDPLLTAGDKVTEMFVFPDPDILEVGQSLKIGSPKLTVRAAKGKLGNLTVQCHTHAAIDQAFLIPNGQDATTGSTIEVV
jgi:hypothetical protein